MRKPFWLIDGKLREADFFLDKLRTSLALDDARFYFSAFVSATRSVTYAIQACLKRAPGFSEWYAGRRAELTNDPLAKYFLCARNTSVHVGLNPLGLLQRSMLGTSEFFLYGEKVPERNAVAGATRYMSSLVDIAGEAFSKFWSFLDLSHDVTLASLLRDGHSIEDIEAEFGLPKGWSRGEGRTDEERLELLKQYSRTDIQRLRQKYPMQAN